MHVAAEQGALDACKLIIEIGGRSLIHEKDSKKQTPLHLATLNGHARSIKLLIEFGGISKSSVNLSLNKTLFS